MVLAPGRRALRGRAGFRRRAPAAAARLTSERAQTNSSPLHRTVTSYERSVDVIAAGTSRSRASPAAWPSLSLTARRSSTRMTASTSELPERRERSISCVSASCPVLRRKMPVDSSRPASLRSDAACRRSAAACSRSAAAASRSSAARCRTAPPESRSVRAVAIASSRSPVSAARSFALRGGVVADVGGLVARSRRAHLVRSRRGRGRGRSRRAGRPSQGVGLSSSHARPPPNHARIGAARLARCLETADRRCCCGCRLLRAVRPRHHLVRRLEAATRSAILPLPRLAPPGFAPVRTGRVAIPVRSTAVSHVCWSPSIIRNVIWRSSDANGGRFRALVAQRQASAARPMSFGA